MKILLLHPSKSAELGPWRETHWDWIVDLGWMGRSAYCDLAQRFGCRAFSIHDSVDCAQRRTGLRELLQAALGYLVDAENVDWWDVYSSVPYDLLDQILLLSALAKQIPTSAEIVATRPHFAIQILSALLNREIKAFIDESDSADGTLYRYYKAARTFRPSQLVQIALDKWDMDYRFRRHWSPVAKAATEPAILLPSSYVNVSRVQANYAQMLPHRKFLLIITRPNGGQIDLPKNVELRSLASYSPKPFLLSTEKEHAHLVERWRKLQSKIFQANGVLRLANKLNVFARFPSFLQKGLRIRDAWRNVFAREPIQAVLSADENSPFTRLPVLLGRSRNISTVLADHGALNMTVAVRPLAAAKYLVQSEMAMDYVVNWCGVSVNQVFVGAAAAHSVPRLVSNAGERDWIILFSSEYTPNTGRAEVFYKEILPHLCTLATQTQRKVIIKLHPFESYSERTRLVEKLLSLEQRRLVELRDGPLTPELLNRAWFTLTVESSAAVESALQGVPCFLCGWFDSSWYEYGTQFAKFSAAQVISSPEDILAIPKRLEVWRITPTTQDRLARPIRPEELESLILGIAVETQ